jgi:hypothetical protein
MRDIVHILHKKFGLQDKPMDENMCQYYTEMMWAKVKLGSTGTYL